MVRRRVLLAMGSSRAAVGRSLCGRGRERRGFGNVGGWLHEWVLD